LPRCEADAARVGPRRRRCWEADASAYSE